MTASTAPVTPLPHGHSRLASDRQQRILSLLSQQSAVAVTHLARDLGVSTMTVRRDLAHLETRSLLVRVHGGATAPRTARRLGATPRRWLAISAGQACEDVAQGMLALPGLHVVTNGVGVAERLLGAGAAREAVVLTGGERTPADALVGPLATNALRIFHFLAAVVHVDGVDTVAGLTVEDPAEAEIVREMLRRSRHAFAVCDRAAFGRRAATTVAPLAGATLLPTSGDQAGRLLMDLLSREPAVPEVPSGDASWSSHATG